MAEIVNKKPKIPSKTCSICFRKAVLPRITPCKHVFCKDCIEKWRETSKKCPLFCQKLKDGDIKEFLLDKKEKGLIKKVPE